MSSTVTYLLTLLVSIVGGMTNATQIENVIATLEQIISSGITLVETEIPIIQNIINALKSNTAVSAAQLTQLQAQEAALDAQFESAAAADGAAPATGS